MSISPLGSPFSNFAGNIPGLEKIGLPKDAALAATAIAGIASGLKGDSFGSLVETVARSIKADPQTAAELARQFTQLGAAVIRGSANEQEVSAANAQPFMEETTTTKRVEVGEGGKRTVKTTTTTVTERTSDPKTEAAKARLAAQQIEELGSGLVDGKVNLSGQTFTFGQIKNLFLLLDKFERNGRREDSKEVFAEKAPIDINDGGVVKKDAGSSDDLKPNASKSPADVPQSSELDQLAGAAKSFLSGDQLVQLKQLADALDDGQLVALVRKIVS